MRVAQTFATPSQSQALLDVAHIAFDGGYAAFYAHGLFGGSRVKETKRMGVEGFDPEDGVQAVSTEAAKKDEARESTLYNNLIVIVEALKSAGLYTNKNLRPNHNQRAAIHILAGFAATPSKLTDAQTTNERDWRHWELSFRNTTGKYPSRATRCAALHCPCITSCS